MSARSPADAAQNGAGHDSPTGPRSVREVDHRPAVWGAALAVAIAALGIAVVASAPNQTRPLAVVLGGLGLFLGGVELGRRDYRVVGWLLGAVGLAVALGGVGAGVMLPTTAASRAELLPGLVGLVLLAAGAAAVPNRTARSLVLAGSGLAFVTVLVSGIVRGADLNGLLLGTVGAVVAWDVAEHGLSLAEQVGRVARTRANRAVHLIGSLAVGLVGVGLARLMLEVGPTSLSLSGLVLLLLAALVLALALYNE